MLWTLLLIILVMWALGFGFGVAGSLVHILLVIAVVVLLLQLVQGRRVELVCFVNWPAARLCSQADDFVVGV